MVSSEIEKSHEEEARKRNRPERAFYGMGRRGVR